MCYSLVRLVTVLVAFLALLGCDRFGCSDPGTQFQSVEGSELTLADGVQVGVGTVVAIEPASAPAEASALRVVVRLGSLSFWVPDPAAERSRYSDAYSAELYEGLTRFGPDGVELGLAAGFTVDSAGTEYEFTLRPGLKFSNGEPVSADDFKWSWERTLSPRFPKAGEARS